MRLCGGARETAELGDQATLQGEALYATANGRLVVVRYAGAWRNERLTLHGSTRLLGRAVAARRFSTQACVAALESLHASPAVLDGGTPFRGVDEPALPLFA